MPTYNLAFSAYSSTDHDHTQLNPHCAARAQGKGLRTLESYRGARLLWLGLGEPLKSAVLTEAVSLFPEQPVRTCFSYWERDHSAS